MFDSAGLIFVPLQIWGGENSEIFDVELTKGSHGIGITIAGYVTDQGGGMYTIIVLYVMRIMRK